MDVSYSSYEENLNVESSDDLDSELEYTEQEISK